MDGAASASAPSFDWTPIFVVTFCSVLTMYAMCSVLPYVGFMVADFEQVPLNEAGFAAGYVASAYTSGRVFTSYPMGWAADHFGMKPVMLFSLSVVFVSSLLFGLSTNLPMAMTVRFCFGLLNGSVSTARALVPELAGKERVVSATGFVTGARAVAMALGPAAGGLLARPAEQFPSVFSSASLLGRYPYLLPNLVGGSLAFVAIPLTVYFVPDAKGPRGRSGGTPKGSRERRTIKYGSVPGDPSEANRDRGRSDLDCAWHEDGRLLQGQKVEEDPSALGSGGLLSVPHVPALLVMAFIFAAVTIAINEVYPLWALSSKGAGGLEYSTVQISEVLTIAGFGLVLFQFLVYPRLTKSLGVMVVQHTACAILALSVITLPNVRLLSWDDTSLMVISSIVMTSIHSTQAAVNTGLILASTNPVPPHLRGRLSGLFLMAQSLGRAFSPAGAATTLAWSISPAGRGIVLVDHRFIFIVFFVLLVLLAVLQTRSLTGELLTTVVEEKPRESRNGAVP